MKIKIVRRTIFRKQPVDPSDEPIEVSKQEASELITAGKAVAVKEIAVETTDKPMADVETSDAVEIVEIAPPAEEEKQKRGKKKVSE